MDGLLPIIRRKRRPFLVEDAPPVVVSEVESPKVQATKPNVTDATDGTQDTATNDDAEASNQSGSQ